MVNISDFSSVLEIIFAINFVLFVFDVLRKEESRLELRFEYFQKLSKEKIELTKNYELPPLGFLISNTYAIYRNLLIFLSVTISGISLSFLIWSGFEPEASVGTYIFSTFLFSGIIMTPFLAFFTRKTSKAALVRIEDCISSLEGIIKKHKDLQH